MRAQNAWSVISEICAADSRIKALALSRNFGQHYAIAAGLESARSKQVVVIDCDLQDRPEEIVDLYSKAREGHDVVFAEREVRKDGWIKRSTSRMFIAFLNYLTGAKFQLPNREFRYL